MDALERAEEHRDLTAGLEYEASLRGAEEAAEAPLTCFTVQVFGETPKNWTESAALAGSLRRSMAEIEENLNAGILPPGFRAVIREWDEED